MNFRKIPQLIMDDLIARIPIVQGGMSVGISLSGLASAVAEAGGIGVIGAAGIGADEPDIQTNASTQDTQLFEYDKLDLHKGEDFGCFEMGSTIVIISEPGLFELKITTGQNVLFGQTIAKISLK